jgi:hypothetical protein
MVGLLLKSRRRFHSFPTLLLPTTTIVKNVSHSNSRTSSLRKRIRPPALVKKELERGEGERETGETNE